MLHHAPSLQRSLTILAPRCGQVREKLAVGVHWETETTSGTRVCQVPTPGRAPCVAEFRASAFFKRPYHTIL